MNIYCYYNKKCRTHDDVFTFLHIGISVLERKLERLSEIDLELGDDYT